MSSQQFWLWPSNAAEMSRFVQIKLTSLVLERKHQLNGGWVYEKISSCRQRSWKWRGARTVFLFLWVRCVKSWLRRCNIHVQNITFAWPRGKKRKRKIINKNMICLEILRITFSCVSRQVIDREINHRADKLAGKTMKISAGFRLGRSDVLMSFRHYLWEQSHHKDTTPTIA